MRVELSELKAFLAKKQMVGYAFNKIDRELVLLKIMAGKNIHMKIEGL